VTTNFVRDYCRAKHARPIPRINTKGASHIVKKLLGKSDGKKREHKPWMVDVSTIKGMLLPRLKMADPIMVHFTNELPADYYAQLTSESLVRKLVKGFPKLEWVKDPKVNNEGLDTLVLSYAAALFTGLKTMNWKRRRVHVEATKPIAEVPPPTGPQPMQQLVSRPPRRGGWVTGWRP
jgi:phage terminase large subunit GpA-like protein